MMRCIACGRTLLLPPAVGLGLEFVEGQGE